MYDFANVDSIIDSATASIYAALICIVVIFFARAANACDIGVMKNPIPIADAITDFAKIGALNILIAITSAKFLNPVSTRPAKKHRRLSKMNVFFAVFVFEKFSNITARMIHISKMQDSIQRFLMNNILVPYFFCTFIERFYFVNKSPVIMKK